MKWKAVESSEKMNFSFKLSHQIKKVVFSLIEKKNTKESVVHSNSNPSAVSSSQFRTESIFNKWKNWNDTH